MGLLPVIAALPIGLIFFALIGLKKSAELVAPLGWALSALLAWSFWGTAPRSIALVSIAGVVWAALVFIWGVFGAFFFLNFLKVAGLLERIKAVLTAISRDRGMQILLVMFSFAMFLGAVAPAGSCFVVAGSMLSGLGIPPLTVAAMGMFGNAPQSPYGILGVPIHALVYTTGLPEAPLSIAIAQLFSVFLLLAPLWIVLFLEHQSKRRMLGPAVIVGLVYAAAQYLTVNMLGVELVNITAGLAAMGTTIALARWRRGPSPAGSLSRRDLSCLVPFAVLIVLVLLTQLIPTVKATLAAPPFTVSIDFRTQEGIEEVVKFGYLSSAGTMAVGSVFISLLLLRVKPSVVGPIARQTLRQVLPMAIAVASFAAMANVMKDFGMNTTMAQAMVDIAGRGFPLVSPLVGMLGTAITGSTAASNIFFGGFQMDVAQSLGLSKAAVGASQVIGCTAGEIICPFNALTITAGLGLKGEEGALMRRMAPSVVLYALLAMVGSFLFITMLSS